MRRLFGQSRFEVLFESRHRKAASSQEHQESGVCARWSRRASSPKIRYPDLDSYGTPAGLCIELRCDSQGVPRGLTHRRGYAKVRVRLGVRSW
jgi:hypothetical protein